MADDAAVTVMLASGGYPGAYETGKPISGLDDVDPDVVVFHAGDEAAMTAGRVVTNGGRVLGVTATAPTMRGRAREGVRERRAHQLRGHALPARYRRDGDVRGGLIHAEARSADAMWRMSSGCGDPRFAQDTWPD